MLGKFSCVEIQARCSAPIVERTDARDPVQALVCQAGCGSLIDSLDRNLVNTFPGGTGQLAKTLLDAFR